MSDINITTVCTFSLYIFTKNVLVEVQSSKFEIGSVAMWSRSNIVLLLVFSPETQYSQ